MRTTLTLDDDVAIQIQRLQKQKGARWKTLVNDALRLGLVQMEAKQPPGPREPPTRPRALGRCKISIVSTSDALAFGEGEDYR